MGFQIYTDLQSERTESVLSGRVWTRRAANNGPCIRAESRQLVRLLVSGDAAMVVLPQFLSPPEPNRAQLSSIHILLNKRR